MKNQISKVVGVGAETGSVMDCGGKHSATPLSPVLQLANDREPASAQKRRRRSPIGISSRFAAQECTYQHPTGQALPAQPKTARSFVTRFAAFGAWNLGASLVLGFWCLVLLSGLHASAQSYSMDWFKIAGGGGASTNGQFTLNGTIGQPDASTALTGRNYSLTGGFWSLFAMQTPGAPALAIRQSGADVIIYWPSSPAGFLLQQNANLATTNWTSFVGLVGDDGTTKSVTNPPPSRNMYFRLIHP